MFKVSFRILILLCVAVVGFTPVESYQSVEKKVNNLQKSAEKYYLKYESLDPLNNMYMDNRDYIRKKRRGSSHKIYNMNDDDTQKLREINNSEEFMSDTYGSGDSPGCGFSREGVMKGQQDMCVCSCCVGSEKAKLLREVILLLTDVMKYKNANSAPTTFFHSFDKLSKDLIAPVEDFSREFAYDDLHLPDEDEPLMRKDLPHATAMTKRIPDPVNDAEYEEQFSVTFRRDPNKGPNSKIHFAPAASHKQEVESNPFKGMKNGPTILEHKSDNSHSTVVKEKNAKFFSLKPFFYRKGAV
ncbi:uncharacterized protein LOC129793848 isoform X2 [Lutzomyia longipalpis]|uniref:uncharacterized protein LOC129793848 isoform X2 n=1 Tax=Lutzomyia longipalpis TaxID=7200 RepID=UPI0024845ACC|nr:uncharacterized protein LOC129793848 isoform X2 [Lutzomyia longipalpis]